MFTEGLKSGTLSTGTLLAEWVNSSGGTVSPSFSALLSASIGAQLRLEHRNAANSANVEEFTFFVGATNPTVVSDLILFYLDAGERVRVVLALGLLGNVQAALIT